MQMGQPTEPAQSSDLKMNALRYVEVPHRPGPLPSFCDELRPLLEQRLSPDRNLPACELTQSRTLRSHPRLDLSLGRLVCPYPHRDLRLDRPGFCLALLSRHCSSS